MLEEIASMEKGEQGTKVNGLAAALQSFAFFFSLRSAVIVFSWFRSGVQLQFFYWLLHYLIVLGIGQPSRSALTHVVVL